LIRGQSLKIGNAVSESDLHDAIRRATIARKFVPLFMGISDERYKGLELLLEAVIRYLPSPTDVSNYALDQNRNGEKVELCGRIDRPFVALAFTMERRMLCKLSYLRIYQSVIRKGGFITNANTGKKIKLPLLFTRHNDGIEDVDEAHAGHMVAVYGADCESGDTFTDGSVRYTMPSVNVTALSVSKDLWRAIFNCFEWLSKKGSYFPS